MTSKVSASSTNISPELVAKLCFDKFKNLPKTGKPTATEWTILAGTVLHNKITGRSEVISLGCGTKCIGKSKLCPNGLIINDSHAEVMARRGLLRYCYYQLTKSLEQSGGEESCIFLWQPDEKKFQLKEELSLHFLSTQTPCGDACIIVSKKVQEDLKDEPLVKRCKVEEEILEDTNVGCIVESVYTGAKLIGSHHSDAMQQLVGAVRTKPGRGERTLSMSCSDKLAKWQVMGVQGALLDSFLAKPLYFDTLNFWCHNDIEALERSIWKRFQNNVYKNSKYRLYEPKIRICNDATFLYAQDSTKQPSPNGLVWCNIPESLKPYEIAVNGKKQGVTSKKFQSLSSALKISKFFLLKEFINVLKLKPDLLLVLDNIESKSYFDCKSLALDYQKAWTEVKLHYFKQWSQKPENLLQFSVKEVENKECNKKYISTFGIFNFVELEKSDVLTLHHLL